MIQLARGIEQPEASGAAPISSVSDQKRNSSRPGTRMDAVHWIPTGARSLLDVGCNVGELLYYSTELFPEMRLAGVEVNAAALEKARVRLGHAELHHAGAEKLPFPDSSFDCVTMIEVLEHIPSEIRRESFSELWRVLATDGVLIVRTPHSGLFGWLDPNNLRFHLPRLYRLLVGKGCRDAGYGGSEGVVWHHHFSREELLDLAGNRWKLEQCCMGGLFLMPLMGILLWPFYRNSWTNNWFYRALARLSAFDLGCSYGRFSYDILLVLRKLEPTPGKRDL